MKNKADILTSITKNGWYVCKLINMEIYVKWNVLRVFRTAYRPRGNGIVEPQLKQ